MLTTGPAILYVRLRLVPGINTRHASLVRAKVTEFNEFLVPIVYLSCKYLLTKKEKIVLLECWRF